MATLAESFVDLETSRGLMRVHLFIPVVGRKCPKNNTGVPLVSDYDLVNAEANEQAEAIVRAIGKWIED